MGKTLYHSELVKAGQCEIIVDTNVIPSRYQNQPPFIGVIFNGEQRRYNCESKDCEILGEHKGKIVTLTAWGGKDQPSGFDIISTQDRPAGSGGGYQNAQTPPPQNQGQGGGYQQSPSQPPPQQQQSYQRPPSNSDPEKEADQQICRTTRLYMRCLDSTMEARRAFSEKHGEQMSESMFQGMTTAIFIESCRKGLVTNMKVGKFTD